ncbi:UBX domain-containing protein 1-like [Corticium candelabrum]|uniref:UBX domain-containing protein 1-like n=1 Tax=Corticium candelabrum TaxID=121492 RepID=UPI002E2624F3|nr:UBX domain-containing protein 1-like [Corticium candelabrum]
MGTPLDQLVEMGFPRERAEKALIASDNKGAEAAMEWLLSHSGDLECGHVLGQTDSEGSGVQLGGEVGGDQQQHLQALSIKCDECGKLLCSEKEAQAHATRTGHSQFSESVEEIKPLTEEEKKEQQRKLQDLLKQKRADRIEREKNEEKEREKARRKGGKELAEAKQKLEIREAQKLAVQKKREQQEDALARQRVRDQIARDKAERQSKAKLEKQTAEATIPSSIQSVLSESKGLTIQKDYTECRLQIRLTDGSALRNAFKPTDTIQTVIDYVAANRKDSAGSFVFATYRGTKDFGPADAFLTLQDAGLVPSSVLIVKKV